MADHPDPTDIRGWRERLLAASDREERQGVLRAWARACGCEFGEGAAAHVITPPDTLDPIVAAVMHAWATNNGLHLKPPLGSWGASDARMTVRLG